MYVNEKMIPVETPSRNQGQGDEIEQWRGKFKYISPPSTIKKRKK
jgi:hypothetical protein